jgi:hypothetical protein
MAELRTPLLLGAVAALAAGLLTGCATSAQPVASPTPQASTPAIRMPVITPADLAGFVYNASASSEQADGNRKAIQQDSAATGCYVRYTSVYLDPTGWFPQGYQTRDWVASQTVLDSYLFRHHLSDTQWEYGTLHTATKPLDTIEATVSGDQSGKVAVRANSNTGQIVIVAQVCPAGKFTDSLWNTQISGTRIDGFVAPAWSSVDS